MKVEDLPKGHKIYTYLRHMSQSKMTRWIDLQYVDPDTREIFHVITPDNFRYKYNSGHAGFKIEGSGMDMGFKLVYDLGLCLHNDGYYFTHAWG